MSRNPHKASNVNDKNERQHRFTPRWLIKALHMEFSFTMDACGHPLSPASQIIGRGYTLMKPSKMLTHGNCYEQSWHQHRVFLQPDFSKLARAVEMASAFIACLAPPELVVLLCPWNRQEQPAWQAFIEPYRDGRGDMKHATIETRAIKGRVKYGNPQDPEGEKAGSPNFGSGLIIWRRKI